MIVWNRFAADSEFVTPAYKRVATQDCLLILNRITVYEKFL